MQVASTTKQSSPTQWTHQVLIEREERVSPLKIKTFKFLFASRNLLKNAACCRGSQSRGIEDVSCQKNLFKNAH